MCRLSPPKLLNGALAGRDGSGTDRSAGPGPREMWGNGVRPRRALSPQLTFCPLSPVPQLRLTLRHALDSASTHLNRLLDSITHLSTSMSFPGQSHHPHTPGQPPNQHLFLVGGEGCDGYLPKGIELVQAHVFHRHGERARE